MMSTPALAAMVIEASLKLLGPLLPVGWITVGKQLELVHDAPTLVGEKIHVEVSVHRILGGHIHLNIRAWDRMGAIARGTHERIIVERERLMSDAYERTGTSRP
jgi:predicted thioesterase